jgi:hypothetical protein
MVRILTDEERAARDQANRDHMTVTTLRRLGKGYLVRLYPPNCLYHGYLSPRAMAWLELAGNRIVQAPGGYIINPSGQQRVGVL